MGSCCYFKEDEENQSIDKQVQWNENSANPQPRKSIESNISCSTFEIQEGLPNLGLTCYLNTVLLLLFSMKKLRILLIKNYEQRPDLPWNKCVGNIFKAILNKKPLRQKAKALEKLFELFEKDKQGIVIKSQNDLIKIFNALVYELIVEDEEIGKRLFFNSQKLCQCQLDIEYSELLASLTESCSECGQKITSRVIQPVPFYLTLVVNSVQNPANQTIVYKDQGGREYRFELISFANYCGNTRSGHYTCVMKQDNKWKEINDNKVEAVLDGQQWTKVSRISIYQRKK